MSERDAAWAAYQATGADHDTGRPAASPEAQERARRRYDAAVELDERFGERGIVGTRVRMTPRRRTPATDARGRRVSAWDPEPR